MNTEERNGFDSNEQTACESSEQRQSLPSETDKLAESVGEDTAEESKDALCKTQKVTSMESNTPASTSSGDMSCPQIRNAALITQRLDSMESAAVKTANEMRELHKLYHNEFAGRLKNMQDELDDYHEINKGRVFDGILAEIAKLYSDNEKLADTLESKQLKFMFMDLLQMLENNGVQVQRSKVGEKRNTKYSQIIEQVVTDNPELHDTVSESLNTGFYVENRTLVKERVHVNVFKEQQAKTLDSE